MVGGVQVSVIRRGSHTASRKLEPYKQATKYTCGPASLKIALKLIGLEYEEGWLAKQMRTSPNSGTSPSGFEGVLRRLGFDYFETANAEIDDIRRFVRQGLPVVVAWDLRGDGHYSVVVRLTGQEIHMIEPFHGKLVRMRIRKFVNRWRDPCNNTSKWMLAIMVARRR